MTVPLTVIEAESLLPAVIVKPVVLAKVSVPCCTESASESVPGLASLTVMPLPWELAKGSAVFSFSEALDGAVIVGARALTVSATDAEPDLPSFESTTEIDSVSEPAKPVAG